MTDNNNVLLDADMRAVVADLLGGTSPKHIAAAVELVALELSWDGFDLSQDDAVRAINAGKVTQLTAEVAAAVKDGSLVPSERGLASHTTDKSRTGDGYTQALAEFEQEFVEALNAEAAASVDDDEPAE